MGKKKADGKPREAANGYFQVVGPLTPAQVLEVIRLAITSFDKNIPEEEFLELLIAESEAWKMRMDEIDGENNNDE